MILDKWQQDVLATKGNLVLRSGRQVGKSTIIGLKAAKYALENANKTVMVIAKVERQAQLLFSKILLNIHEIDKNAILKGRDRKTRELLSPTKTKINLKNGSTIHCLPAGETGYGIMGYTLHLLIADEAAFIPEQVWNSIIPALAVSKGNIWLLSTPFLKEGYYYNCFTDPSFTTFHMSSEDCIRKDEQFLAHKKATLTRAQYAQMYLGQFVDELTRVVSEALITDRCIGKRAGKIEGHEYFLGVDIARMGEDASTFEIFDGTNPTNIIQLQNIVTTKTMLTETEDKIIKLDRTWDFGRKAIGLDDAGIGAGVHDSLLRNDQVKRKIVGLMNAKRSIDTETRTKTLLKEDMYNNMLRLMERKEVTFLDDPELKASLRSLQFDEETQRINGNDTHIAEGVIRALWVIKQKGLKVYVF